MFTTDLDLADPERSRAAVAVACLRWLRCTGPSVDNGSAPDGSTWPPVDARPAVVFPVEDPHPLWDRWLDG